MKLSIICLLALAGAASAAQAQNRGSGWEFGIDGIYQDSTDLSFDGGSSAQLEDDIGFAAYFQYRFNQRFEIGFAIDWSLVDYDVTIQSALDPDLQFRGTGEFEAITPRIMANF